MKSIEKIFNRLALQAAFVLSAIGLLLSVALLFTGCGDGGSSEDSILEDTIAENGGPMTIEKIGALEAEWKTRCVDENLPLIQLNYEKCLTQDWNTPEICENNAEFNTIKLMNTWNSILSRVRTEMSACNNDPRSFGEFCRSEYEFKLSFYVNMSCYTAATGKQ